MLYLSNYPKHLDWDFSKKQQTNPYDTWYWSKFIISNFFFIFHFPHFTSAKDECDFNCCWSPHMPFRLFNNETTLSLMVKGFKTFDICHSQRLAPMKKNKRNTWMIQSFSCRMLVSHHRFWFDFDGFNSKGTLLMFRTSFVYIVLHTAYYTHRTSL